MPVILALVSLTLLLLLLAGGSIAGFKFIEFSLGYAVEFGASEFWAPDNFLAWIIAILLGLLALGVVRQVCSLLWKLLSLLPILGGVWLFHSKKVAASIIFFIGYGAILLTASITLSVWLTSAFFDFTGNYEHLTTFFQHGNFWAYVSTLSLVQFILLPTFGNLSHEES